MIDDMCFSTKWYETVKGEYRSDINVIERQIFAFHLLESLVDVFDDFIFKGGTSLSLISDDFPRFSVDIDILVHPKHKPIFKGDILEQIIHKSRFTTFEVDVRKPKMDIEKMHFKFYFTTHTGQKLYVLLDIVFSENPYDEIKNQEISNYLFKTIPPKKSVKIPDTSNLIADKLCAFAPHSTGKNLRQGRDIEVIKQMYDVSFLMDHYPLAPDFHKTYKTICNKEIARRRLTISYKEVLIDSIQTASNILTEGEINEEEYKMLKTAIRRFVPYTRNHAFTVDNAKTAAVKTIYAALLVFCEGPQTFNGCAEEVSEFKAEYKIFKRTRKILRRSDMPLYDLLDQCLKVMTTLDIQLLAVSDHA